MARAPAWGGDTPDQEAWDVCSLGGVLLPGIASVTVSGRGRNIDEQASKGTDGVELKDNGLTVAKISIRLVLTETDWPDWLNVLPKIDPQRPGAMRQPLQIVHPEPNHVGIELVYVREISGEPPDLVNGKVITIDCGQWFPQKKATKTSKQPKRQGGSTTTFNDNPTPSFSENALKPMIRTT